MFVPTSLDLIQNSVQAALAAIEIYNKPSSFYREEGFSLLLVNAWELLLKARWVKDHDEKFESLFIPSGLLAGEFKQNRSGNPVTHGLTYLAKKYVERPEMGFDTGCENNVLALMEIRDAAAHFVNTDLYLARRVLEIGTASLRNYLQLSTEWFSVNLNAYNFFIMPLAFHGGFETAFSANASSQDELVIKLIGYLDGLEASTPGEGKPLSIKIETKLSRSKDKGAVPFRITADPSAPAVILREEDILENYPYDYASVAKECKLRYSDFSQNARFHQLMKSFCNDMQIVHERKLDPRNVKSGTKRLYNGNIFAKLDGYYTKGKKLAPQSVLPIDFKRPASAG